LGKIQTVIDSQQGRSVPPEVSRNLPDRADMPAAPSEVAPPIPTRKELQDAYGRRAYSVMLRHQAQTVETVAALRRKYAQPVFGRVTPWSLVEKLAQCIDPTDQRLYCVSQQVHVLQIIDAMEAEGTATEEFLLLALVHDLGKVLLLTGEAPENIVCMNRTIAGELGAGLENCVMQWNHDEFAYTRLKEYLPDHLAWLVRNHSVAGQNCEPFMDARDRYYAERFLRPFARYDHFTKSPVYLPQRRIEDYRHIVERALPASILF
jgi:predicted HD phosphohydrolase